MATRSDSERHGHGMSEKIWDSVKQWFLGVLAEEQNRPIIAAEQAPAPDKTSPNTCPRCGAPNSFNEVAANILRCCACGFQGVPPRKTPSIPPIIGKRIATPARCSACGSELVQA